MQNYTEEQIKALLPEQIQALTAVQIQYLTKYLTKAQIVALSYSMEALNVAPLRASSWTEVAVKETKIIEQEIGKY